MAAVVSDFEHVMHKKLTVFFLTTMNYRLNHRSAGIDVNTAAAFQDTVLAAIDVQNAQKSQVPGTGIMNDEKKAMKPHSVVEKSSQDPSEQMSTVLADLGVMTKAEATEIVESRMAKIHEQIKAEVVETVSDTLEDALQSSFWT